MVVPQIDTLIILGRTPRRNPHAPCSLYSSRAV
eukprot:CAMPEP_0197600996 /NCGR_PEP_ID=MMETSP1326-20131121/34457_1 /TAXON_ID=1155430 /ORGANISM="Genus nov. species nov., Strain RCC2288" /LENGTH=32 /DNA_ID= /DNA_START= /DNA_END= /DNA_ORIENTATION=